ncbi:protocatechuate 3,4-dioxygenase subunit beta [Nordella sp. HKS 07]|uniref:protocatechuate 3,4-dioxygenase subunit beta n=1 Tax=Nordella sp. HKS 07 TaxID=2712222 RepID=UPI0013E1A7DF|nr:protocatechuate 3,4-dioxygenase subunit beta [Nordella sp. HKS 07]QIG49981.1 protocatechuate 3,4-dioxygenase subunit beta [Nordella sp. HKS 07]
MIELVEFIRRDRAWHPPADTPRYNSTSLRAPHRKLLSLPQSIGELSGPVFGHDKLDPLDADLIRNYASDGEAIGERILVHGKVMDETGRPVPHTLIEIWQANAGGRYRHVRDNYMAALDRNFGGCGRCLTDAEGHYSFRTIKPGPYPWRNNGSDWRPAHIHLSLFGHAFVQRLVTQLYFEGDPLIQRCAIVNTIRDPAAIDQLTAKLDMDNMVPFDSLVYRFDIVLRGRQATYFENRPEGS